MAAVSSPWAYTTFTDCLRAPLPARGERDPFFAQCLLAGAFVPRGLYIHMVHPTPSMLHACYILQPKRSPSVPSTLPPVLGVVG